MFMKLEFKVGNLVLEVGYEVFVCCVFFYKNLDIGFFFCGFFIFFFLSCYGL